MEGKGRFSKRGEAIRNLSPISFKNGIAMEGRSDWVEQEPEKMKGDLLGPCYKDVCAGKKDELRGPAAMTEGTRRERSVHIGQQSCDACVRWGPRTKKGEGRAVTNNRISLLQKGRGAIFWFILKVCIKRSPEGIVGGMEARGTGVNGRKATTGQKKR